MKRIGCTLVLALSVGVSTVLAPAFPTTRDRPAAVSIATPAPSPVAVRRSASRAGRPAAVRRAVRASLPSLPVSALVFENFPVVEPSVPVSPASPVNGYALQVSLVLPSAAFPSSAFPSARLPVRRSRTRPSALVPMYASFATLQALDYHSTTSAVSEGIAREANPIVRQVVDNPPAFIALKAAATVAIVYQAERMWKDHPVRAIVFMAAANAALGIVVARNYSIK